MPLRWLSCSEDTKSSAVVRTQPVERTWLFICVSNIANRSTGEQKVLKPTEFQNFELSEKTIISHNVAM